MPRVGRQNVTYVKIPEEYTTKSLPEAKLQVSITATVPAGWEKAMQKLIDEANEEVAKKFKKGVKKHVDKLSGD